MQNTLVAWQTAMGHWPIAAAVRETVWVKALLESAHIMAMGLVLFAVGMITLRLAGLAGPVGIADRDDAPVRPLGLGRPDRRVHHRPGPAHRGRKPARHADADVQLKMVLMFISILTTAALQLTLQSNAAFWEMTAVRRAAARLIAPVCLLLWMATVCTGRWLAYASVLFPNA